MKNKLFIVAISLLVIYPLLQPIHAEEGTPSPTKFKKEWRQDVQNLRTTIKLERDDIKNDKKDLLQKVKDLKDTFVNTFARVLSGTVTAINGTSLTINSAGKNIIVNTDSKTKFRRHFWGSSSLAEISVNDKVNIYGKYTDTARTTIQATMIRDTSIMKRFGVFVGDITSITGNTLVLKTEARGTQTVTLSSSTKFTDRKGGTLTQTDLKTGHRIRVRGMWDSKNNTIIQVNEVKDYSLPALPTSTK